MICGPASDRAGRTVTVTGMILRSDGSGTKGAVAMTKWSSVPGTCPIGGAAADNHGSSRSAGQWTRRLANRQAAALQRHRVPKLIVRVRFPSPAPR